MRHIAVIALALCLTGSGSAARADDANRTKLARDLVELTHLSEKIRALLPSLAPAVRQALSREMVDAASTEEAVRIVQGPSPEDLDRLMDQVASLYARELTEQDLSDTVAFYRTPSGRDLLAKEAEIGGAIGTVALHWAVTLADRTAAGFERTSVPDAGRWRQDYIAVPSRAAVLQSYLDPMDTPELTALRTVSLARLIAERCRDVRSNDSVLASVWHRSGLDAASIDDLGLMNAIVAPSFSYFDHDRLQLVCAASDDLFGVKGRLVPDLLSPGDGLPKGAANGYIRVPTFTNPLHGRG